MSNELRESLHTGSAAPIVLGSTATPWRISKEQLAAAERARLYHVNKLAAYRPVDPLLPTAQQSADAGDASGAA